MWLTVGKNQKVARRVWWFVMEDTFRSVCICIASAAVHGWLAFALLQFLLACGVRVAAAIAGDVWQALTSGTSVMWVCGFVGWVAMADPPLNHLHTALLGAVSPGWSSALLPLINGGFRYCFGPHPLPAVVLYLLGLLLRLCNWWLAVPVAALASGLLIGAMYQICPPPPPPPRPPPPPPPPPPLPPRRRSSFRKLGTAPLPAGCCGPVRQVLLASDYYEVCCSIRGLELLEFACLLAFHH